jgi:hypothetical protein
VTEIVPSDSTPLIRTVVVMARAPGICS